MLDDQGAGAEAAALQSRSLCDLGMLFFDEFDFVGLRWADDTALAHTLAATDKDPCAVVLWNGGEK